MDGPISSSGRHGLYPKQISASSQPDLREYQHHQQSSHIYQTDFQGDVVQKRSWDQFPGQQQWQQPPPPQQQQQDPLIQRGSSVCSEEVSSAPRRGLRRLVPSALTGGAGPSSLPPSVVEQMTADVLLMGWLHKHSRSTFGHRWSLRYFVLRPQQLSFYRTQAWQHEQPVKEYKLTPACRVDDTGRLAGNQKELYTISIQSEHSKPFLVGAKDPEVAGRWLDEIRATCMTQGTSMGDLTLRRPSSINSMSDEEEGDTPPHAHSLTGDGMDPSDVDDVGDAVDNMDTPLLQSTDGVSVGPSGPRIEKRGSVGFGPPMELGGMLEAMVAMRSASSAAGIAADGSWRLVRLANGLRFFEEVADGRAGAQCFSPVPCMSALGTIEAPPDAVFKLILDLSMSRNEWDVAYSGARVVEMQDGHTDCIHYRMRPLPLGPGPLMFAPRDLCLRRYWQRTGDGCYVVLYMSMEHPLCPPVMGCVRARIIYGGFFVAPVTGQGGAQARSVCMHVLQMEAKGGPYIPCSGVTANLHNHLLSRVAGIREFFSQTRGDALPALLGISISHPSGATPASSAPQGTPSPSLFVRDSSDGRGGRVSDAARSLASDMARAGERGGSPSDTPITLPVGAPRIWPMPKDMSIGSSAATAIVAESVSISGFESLGGSPLLGGVGKVGAAAAAAAAAAVASQRWAWLSKMGTLARGSPQGGINCWSEAEARLFSVRSKSYLRDKEKQAAGFPGMQLVAVDWLRSSELICNVVEQPRSPLHAMRNTAEQQHPDSRPFFLVINMQVPAAQHYSMVFYWAISDRPSPDSLMGRFIDGDENFRNSRFKLIPRIHQGAWVVKRSVGTTPLIIAGQLTVQYFQGRDYLECDVDIGSSAVANGIVRFVLGYVRTLVVDMAFLLQSNTEEELPEKLLGTVRISHLEPNAALDLDEPSTHIKAE